MFVFRFGASESRVESVSPGSIVVSVAGPLHAGSAEEEHAFPVGEIRREGDWILGDSGETLCGAVAVPVTDADLESVTRGLYESLLRRTRGLHLYRIWHHVPRIVVTPPGMEENYRRFCRARASAFEDNFSVEAERRMCAASAVGVDGDRIVVAFFAGRVKPEHFENPEQTPAYRYPEKYGPKSPSFARATRVKLAGGEWLFVSGTAAIRGSESRHPGDFDGQAAVTAENLSGIRGVAGVPRGAQATLRTYLKPGSGRTGVDASAMSGEVCKFSVIGADICRAELLLESEITMHAPSSSVS